MINKVSLFSVMNTLFLLLFELYFLTAAAAPPIDPEIKVYRNPTCNCCQKWISHLEQNKFNVIDMLTNDMASVKEAVNLPAQMTSCHTAIVEGYIIEGHVPADDIKRLLFEQPDISGLAVPKMPVGSPGMEIGQRKDNFVVFTFKKSGEIGVFNEYIFNSSPIASHQH